MVDQRGTEGADVVTLWRDYGESRSEECRNRLVVQYAPLVKYVAGRLAASLPPHVDVDDLYSDGAVGLVRAVERYDPERGVDFPTFAISRIRGAMVDGMRELDWLPRSARTRVTELETCTQRLYAELQRPPTSAELARSMGIGESEVAARRQLLARSRPVPLELVDPGSSAEPAQGQGPPTLPRGLVRAVRTLPERQQVLMALYYYERLTMAEIGQVLGISESRVSQLHRDVRRTLRDRMHGGG